MSDALIKQDMAGLSVDDVVHQIEQIQNLMKKVMKLNEHYGIKPGTSKPTLLKPGAEKLNFMFRLVPEFEIHRNDLEGGHREYIVKCRLRHLPSGNYVSEGDGSCSTMESKYRYRKGYTEVEVGDLPGKYWSLVDDEKKAFLQKLFGPGDYRLKKRSNGWKVVKIEGDGDKIENKDIADVYNTVLKIAKKRAYVDATILACAVSDIFTQDVEDGIPEPATTIDDEKPKPVQIDGNIREKLIKEISVIINQNNFTEAEKRFYREQIKSTETDRLHLVLEDAKKVALMKKEKGGDNVTAEVY
ncbi:TPA: hypothetical protein ENX78_08530 [Candidatus Poribacteria bacterium]|nr:hypothetical protein [Candidatus Poribacteria bacterium]